MFTGFHVLILILYMGHPDYIWLSSSHWETKEECQQNIQKSMVMVRLTLKEDYEPLVGLCDTEENMKIKQMEKTDEKLS